MLLAPSAARPAQQQVGRQPVQASCPAPSWRRRPWRHRHHQQARSGWALAAAPPPGLEDLLNASPEQVYAAAAAAGGRASRGHAEHWWLSQALQLLAPVAAYAAAVWPSRPRGWCDRGLVEVRRSSVAGMGAFAVADIKAGTVLGCYPGRPRTPDEMLQKAMAAPKAKDYCFLTRSGSYLDPTDATGLPSAHPSPGMPWPLSIDVSIAAINEPPPGTPGGCNVTAEDDPGDADGLLCVAVRDIRAGEELFLDYGRTYNRSTYRRRQQGAAEEQHEQRGHGAGDESAGDAPS